MSTSHIGETFPVRVSRIGLILASGIWAASRAVSSGDLWVALGCGRYTLTHGITRNDPFAFTSLPGGWINQNWLSHVLLTWIHGTAGLAGLGIWKGLVSIAIVWLTADTAMALGAGSLLAAASAVALGLAGRPFFDVRPNLHSVLLAAILIRWIVGIERRRPQRLWAAPAMMILWANLHGGFLFGVIATGAATGALAFARIVHRRRIEAWPGIIALPFTVLAVCIVSPYAITNLSHPWEISAGPAAKEWRGVVEWLPPFAPGAIEDPGVRAFWIVLGLGVTFGIIVLLAALRRRPSGRPLPASPSLPSMGPIAAVALASLMLALMSRRFIPFFAVSVIPWMAAAVARASLTRPIRVPPILWPIAASVSLLTVGIEVGQRLFVANAFWPASISWAERLVRADEQPREAVRFLAGSGVGGHLFTEWTWGGYLLYADPFDGDSPRYRIYIDGRAQAVFPVSAMLDFIEVENAAAAGQIEPVRSFLDHYRVDICIVDRRDIGLSLIVMQLPGWVSVYGDDKAIVAVRSAVAGKMRDGPFPDAAIQRASEALRIRTSSPSGLDASAARRAFDAAVASCSRRATTTGVTEMTRIARTVPEGEGVAMRERAAAVCDSLLALPIGTGGISRLDDLTVRANTAQCRSMLARSARDTKLAERRHAEAASLLDETNRISPRYLR